MSHNELIQAILSKCPEVTESQILQTLEYERKKTAGLIADATLLRLIATRYGVETQGGAFPDSKLQISHLVPNLNRITVSGRVLAVLPVKIFEGEKSGKYASLVIADKKATLRVVLWNDKADLVGNEIVKAGQLARFVRAYTKGDCNGKVELHVSEKSEVEVEPSDLSQEDYPFIDQFLVPVRDISLSSQSVHLAGKVKAIFPMSTFTRQDNSEGKVLRFFIADATGDVMVVAWNDKAENLRQRLRDDVIVKLINARVRASSSGGLEVHVDEATYVELAPIAL